MTLCTKSDTGTLVFLGTYFTEAYLCNLLVDHSCRAAFLQRWSNASASVCRHGHGLLSVKDIYARIILLYTACRLFKVSLQPSVKLSSQR